MQGHDILNDLPLKIKVLLHNCSVSTSFLDCATVHVTDANMLNLDRQFDGPVISRRAVQC